LLFFFIRKRLTFNFQLVYKASERFGAQKKKLFVVGIFGASHSIGILVKCLSTGAERGKKTIKTLF
jgi:hypothetical protein